VQFALSVRSLTTAPSKVLVRLRISLVILKSFMNMHSDRSTVLPCALHRTQMAQSPNSASGSV